MKTDNYRITVSRGAYGPSSTLKSDDHDSLIFGRVISYDESGVGSFSQVRMSAGYSLSADKLSAIVKDMRKIEARANKIDQIEGPAQSIGQAVNRMVRAFGLPGCYVNDPILGSSYYESGAIVRVISDIVASVKNPQSVAV